MKIIDIEIDGFGVWSGLGVRGIGEGMNVLFGPNEAGKSTLLQFIRGTLYGYGGARRRYLPPLHGGPAGGRLKIVGAHGRFEIERRISPDSEAEETTVAAADGTRHGEHYVKVLVSEIDERTFNNVFAIGLREIQELGALSDSEAAAKLYNLSVGLDHVALSDVMRELAASRNRLLDAEGRPSQIAQLAADRDRLRTEIEELSGINRRYARLAAERNETSDEIDRIESDKRRLEDELHLIDLAALLGERWRRRTGIEAELAALGVEASLPEGALPRFDAIAAKLERHAERIAEIKRQQVELGEEAATLPINEALGRNASRVEALREQEGWLTNLLGQVAGLQKDVAELEGKLGQQREQFGLGKGGQMPTITKRVLASLKAPARAVQAARQRVGEAQEEAVEAGSQADAAAAKLEQALRQRGADDLSTAIDEAGSRVAQLRRRVQVDDRLDQMGRYRQELEDESHSLLKTQLLSMPVLLGLGGVFAVGAVMLLFGAFGDAGWVIGLTGVLSLAVAALGKLIIEKTNARRFQDVRKQLQMLEKQIEQIKEDREALDRQLPRGGGPPASRLQAAEAELAALEGLLPLENQRGDAEGHRAAAALRVEQAEAELTKTRRRWHEALRQAGLPTDMSPKQLHRLARVSDEALEWQRTLSLRRGELEQRQQQLDALVGRIAQLSAEVNVAAGGSPVEQLRRLGEAVVAQQSSVARRDAVRRQIRQLRRRQLRHEESLARWKHRRRALLLECGVESEHGLRELAGRVARATTLRSERESLDREIDAAVAGRYSRQSLIEYFAIERPGELQLRRDAAAARVATAQAELKTHLEKRGQLSEQLAALAADRQLANRQVELASVEQRLVEMVGRWRVLATTCRALDIVRSSYENERQPETLKEASQYLARMTGGRYRRVWTPFGEDVLKVDDAEGRALPVEALSRGTREQLFLSLRLALAAYYARQGAALPLVLDDVLVNFDAPRAQAAAEVLTDFAAAGHQVLVFTCHEHIMATFEGLQAGVGRLPANAERQPDEVRFAWAAKKSKPPREKEAPRRRRAAISEEIEPTVIVAEFAPPEVLPPEEPEFIEPAEPREPTIDRMIEMPAAPVAEETEEEDELIPLVAPKKKRGRKKAEKKAPPKRPGRPRGVFDADFFDSEAEERDKVDALADEDEPRDWDEDEQPEWDDEEE